MLAVDYSTLTPGKKFLREMIHPEISVEKAQRQPGGRAQLYWGMIDELIGSRIVGNFA
jgi:hypothetical protein